MRKLMTAAVLAGTALAIAGCAPRVVYAPPPVVYAPPPPVVYVPPPRRFVRPVAICRWQTRRVVRPNGTVVVQRVRVCR